MIIRPVLMSFSNMAGVARLLSGSKILKFHSILANREVTVVQVAFQVVRRHLQQLLLVSNLEPMVSVVRYVAPYHPSNSR